MNDSTLKERGKAACKDWRVVAVGILLLCVVLWVLLVPPGIPSGLSPEERTKVKDLLRVIEKLRPLQSPVPKPMPLDWQAQYKERRQSFLQYLRTDPVCVRPARNRLYVLPLGQFTAAQRQIVDLTVELLGLYFNIPVQVLPGLALDVVPPAARRISPGRRREQANSIYLLDHVLKPRLPANAVALIALTTVDLWPGPEMNFVFGQASLMDRVGVWSMDRFGDPEAGPSQYRLCLLRTLKTATHETGHMFTLPHCVNYLCNLCGSNHLEEGDRYPLQLCPECLAKVCWATQASPVERYRKLAAFCARVGLEPEAIRYRELLEAVR